MTPSLLRIAVCVASAWLAVGAAAQNDFEFYPRWGIPQGGTEIQVFLTSPYGHFAAPQVFFDGVPSPRVTPVSSNTITAVTPPHAVGIVAITVVDNGGTLRALGSFVFEPKLEPILIPIALKPIDAAYGTRWASTISVYNDSDESIPIEREICYFFGSPRVCSQPARRVAPHASLDIEPRSNWPAEPAMFVLTPADQADHLHFTVRLHELSRSPNGPGTQIPVVRERDFQRTQVWLTAVPNTLGYRSTLRVFSDSLDVTVRVRDEATGELLLERSNSRWIPTDTGTFGTATFTDLLTADSVRSHAKVRIEAQSSRPVWALLTLTENDTQEVQIFTPQ